MVSSADLRAKAIAAFGMDDFAEAAQLFERLVQADPSDHSLRLWLASSQQQAGQFTAAHQTYQHVLANADDPEFISAATNGLTQLAGLVPEATAGFASSDDISLDDVDDLVANFVATDAGLDNFTVDDLLADDQFFNLDASAADPFADMFSGADAPATAAAASFDNLFSFEAEPPESVSPEEGGNETNIWMGDGNLPDFDAHDMLNARAEPAQPPAVDAPTAFSDMDLFGDDDEGNTDYGALDQFSEPLFDESATQIATAEEFDFEADALTDISGKLSESLFFDESPSEGTDIELQAPPQTVFFSGDAPPQPPAPLAAPSEAVGKKPKETASKPAPSHKSTAGGGISPALLQGVATLAVSGIVFVSSQGLAFNQSARFAGSLVGGTVAGLAVGSFMGGKGGSKVNPELQAKLEALGKGRYDITLEGDDSIAKAFNEACKSVADNIQDLQRRAAEQGQAKEDLQRQVIRLLDDVEGAARGDLTVRAEVTADVLGAVADSFNLTINSLREIVSQVKQAATSVNSAAQQNESFARSLSADAMKQSDEVSKLLDSIQAMTHSIQDVATNSREAESVTRRASQVAVEGGQAVDRTVMGILAIREKVAETTRQVKRLAESSQEISKIVALISQISNRTNLLALNASIEAARAGEAGKGFAIVADEIRQLADRAAKASKEIEQLVMQIQSETSLVMTAMEEGTQQVIEGTRLAEQAKESLEEIIQVNQTIDQLMRDITAATVEQTDTSREVSQVMQSTALNASETSRESAHVAASLQELVLIARDLQTSVGKFRIGDETRAAL